MLRIATDLGTEGVGTGRSANSKDFELESLIKEQLRAAFPRVAGVSPTVPFGIRCFEAF